VGKWLLPLLCPLVAHFSEIGRGSFHGNEDCKTHATMFCIFIRSSADVCWQRENGLASCRTGFAAAPFWTAKDPCWCMKMHQQGVRAPH